MSRQHIRDQWLREVFSTKAHEVKPLAGDASFRSYHRVWVAERQFVLMDAPPPEAPQKFVEIALLFREHGLSVPEIVASHLEHGFLLLSDLGDRLYLNELNDLSADGLYQDAFTAIFKMQRITSTLPFFDRPFLERQMDIFEEWYLKKNKGIIISPEFKKILEPVYQLLFETIENQPQVLVHRDYHSRNLMILSEGSPGVLDFQDAVIGPITYDLVSLLQDCYITWPRERVVHWVRDFQLQARKEGRLTGKESETEFLRWFDWTGLQRHLKNLGIFSRLHLRDNKPGYLADIPRVLGYIQETCGRYPELKNLQTLMKTLDGEIV